MINQKLLIHHLLCIFLLCLYVSQYRQALADDFQYLNQNNQELGRTSQGEAYRKDKDGTKIVDYIADLELQVLELNRSLDASRQDNSDLNNEIQRLKSGRQEFIIESEMSELAPKKAAVCNDDNQLKFQYQSCQDELDMQKASNQKLLSNKQQGQDLHQSCMDNLTNVKAEADRLKYKHAELESKFQSLTQDRVLFKSCMDDLNAVKAESDGLKVKYAELESKLQAVTEEQARAALNLAELKSGLHNNFMNLLQQKDARDLLLSRVRRKDRLPGIFRMKPRSLSGKTIEELEREIPAADDLNSIELLSQEVDQLTVRLQTEMQFLQ